MGLIKDLLSRLTNTPPEEQEAAIAEALTGAKDSPAELSEEIGTLFTDVYGDGETVTPQTADQIVARILREHKGEHIGVLAPLVVARKG